MLKYFHGPDTYTARAHIERLRQEQKATLRWVDATELKSGPLDTLLGQGSGLFGADITVVRDPSQLPATVQADLVDILEKRGSQGSYLLWDRGNPDRRSRLWRTLHDRAQAFPHASPQQTAVWLQEQARQRGGTIEPAAAQMLVERLGLDRWRLSNEIERLVLQASIITAAIVAEQTPAPAPAEIFAALDAFVRRDTATVIRLVRNLLQQGNSEIYILSMLAYQLRTILHVQAGLDEKLEGAAIAKEGKLHPYVVEKSIGPARQLSRSYLTAALTKVMATDFAIKQGKVEPRTGVLMLLMNLTR